MIPLTLIVCGCLLLASVVAVLLAAIHAPQGYEDERGFFEGIEPQLQPVLAAGDARLVGAANGRPQSYATRLGSNEDVEPTFWKGLEAAEPIQSTHRASPHAHRAH
jgi:hypothetical protein